ncbi:hypothetical protein NDU88_002150 [Pleurodeles waltl]|uniref:Uncharacterized protein n=1 Tax=Pleurodeles waltl TaxID=8319 RepID=A0AAV7T1K4_PLEWA|nr:hypothetical protein NDU88_002150 [Pleurodeles waltl]
MHSLLRGEKNRRRPMPIDATPSGRPELRRTASQGQRRPTSRGEIDAWRENETLTHSLPERHAARKQAEESMHRPHLVIPQTTETVRAPENDA